MQYIYKILAVLVYGGILASCSMSNVDHPVKTLAELNDVLAKAKPGDIVVLANGEWKDAEIVIEVSGTRDQPIVIRPKTLGGLKLTGNSNLKIGGDFIEVSGLHFTDGYTLTQEVIAFRSGKEKLANNSRVTETVIDNYSNPERHDNDYWVAIYGKNNRFDHNALVGKGNRGVTMAVRLNSEESLDNNHLIDHNYFGPRENLGSNGGETLRIGTSHYSLSYSNTQVINNYFDRCDGEHEIISNKSCGNLFKGNTFYECVGTLTFRHGHHNIAESNAFWGNRKPHTGGIRVINENHKVYNNLGVGLTGHRFRGAFVIMNGVPNSPINRYNQVDSAEVYNNSFFDCDYVQLCAGSDKERSAVPINSAVKNNVFWNTGKNDVFTVYDDVSGITFDNNVVSENIDLFQKEGFTSYAQDRIDQNKHYVLPGEWGVGINDSFAAVAKDQTGPSWYEKPSKKSTFDFGKEMPVQAGADLFEVVQNTNAGDILNLPAGSYLLTKVVKIPHPLTIRSNGGAVIKFEKANLFSIENGGSLKLEGVTVDGSESPDYAGNAVITTSRYSMNRNYKLFINQCQFVDLDVNHSFNLLKVYKNTFADSIMIENSRFQDVSGSILELNKETEDIGIYNAEFVVLRNNSFTNIGREAINLRRGGSDESTFGPLLYVDHCVFQNVGGHKKNKSGKSIVLHGVQRTEIKNSIFTDVKPINIFHTVGEPVTGISHSSFDEKDMLEISDNTAKIEKLTLGKPAFEGNQLQIAKAGSDKKNIGLVN